MSSHFEIVRTDAEQPWHARIVSQDHITLRSENYSRMVGAERCLISTAKTFGWRDVAGLRWNVEGVEKVFYHYGEAFASIPVPSVVYVDERTKR